MELDKRILSGKRPLTCLDAEQAKQFIGKECYFSDYASKYKNLKDIEKANNGNNCKGVLTYVDVGGQELAFFYSNRKSNFRYCLPCEWVEEEKKQEPKYRPYTMEEFIREYTIGESIFKIRDKRDPEHVYEFIYIGHSNSLIYLGGWTLSLEDLFAYFETAEGVGDEETWQLFGILEE